MLVAWMANNNSTDCPMVIKFVQFAKNSAYHAGIKKESIFCNVWNQCKSHHYPKRPSAAYKLNKISSQFFRILTTSLKSLMILTDLDQRQEDIQNQRSVARSSETVQAERMVKRSHIELTACRIEDNIAVPIPLVDRGRGDPRNILGVIVRKVKVISTR